MRMRIVLLIVFFSLGLFNISQAESRGWLFVSLLKQKQIVTFSRDPETGHLTRVRVTDCEAEPACMGVSPDRQTLFVSYRSTGDLASFHIDAQTGTLSPNNVVPGGADPAYLLPDRAGKFLISAYYQANKVAVHQIGPDGSLSIEPLQTIPTADNAHGIALDSGNQFALVPHTGANRIYQFRFDGASGNLTPNDPPYVDAPANDHPRHIALHPSNRWAYVSNEAGDSLGVYMMNQDVGLLEHVQTVPSIPDEFDGEQNSTARCEMTPDGKFVYVANRGHDSIAGYSINQETGQVIALGQFPTEQTPRSFTIEPKGRFLYAAGEGSGRIAAFRILDDGKLERFETYESGPVSWWVQAVDMPVTSNE